MNQLDTKTPTLNRFYIIGKGFIYSKHKEAIEAIEGKIVDSIKMADWVVILTPNYLHFNMIVDAVNNGRNVLCEKPLVLSQEHCEKLIKLQRTQNKKIFTVAQLRYHPVINTIPRRKENEIELFVEVHRDKEYLKSWKGDEKKSGGILYNLGIHYLDLIIRMFGEPKEGHWIILGPQENTGYFKGDGYTCKYTLSYKAPENEQKRIFRINGIEYDLKTTKNLHKLVYQDLLQDRGLSPDEVLPVISLIEKLK